MADAVVSDPPYGINFVHGGGGNGIMGPQRSSKPIHGDDKPFDPSPWLHYDRCVLFGANHFAARIPVGKGDWLTWDKSCGMGPNSSFRDSEFIWSSVKTARTIIRHFWMGALRAGEGASQKQARLHVSQKPVEVMMQLLSLARVGIGKTVLDPYMGSGSTGVACLRTGRKFIGVEIDKDNFRIAVDRIREEWSRYPAK